MDSVELDKNDELFIHRLGVTDFEGMECAWSSLLSLSDADPLFMSWAWQFSWWQVWGRRLGLELLLLGAYDRDGALVGLAPLYRHTTRAAVGISFSRLQFIGNAWRVSPTVRTEYVSLITLKGSELSVANAVMKYLDGLSWDAMVIPDCLVSTLKLFEQVTAMTDSLTQVIRSVSYGVDIDTSGSFRSWCRGLGANTRLKAWNRRKLFCEGMGGGFRIFLPSTEQDYREFFVRLNAFHLSRWGRRCFDDLSIEFHCKFLQRLSSTQLPSLSELVVGSNVVSVLYDIQCGSRIYNIQSGYEEQFHPKLSLGTLHFGYSIERAFESRNVDSYDLLAGAGKNSFYKSHFKGEEIKFFTADFVRSPVLKAAYLCRSWLPKGFTSRLNRIFRL